MSCLQTVVLGVCMVFFSSLSISHAATLESPARGAQLSGLGFISGWKCEAGAITVQLDGGAPMPVLYGNERLDTHVSRGGPCRHSDTGYILQINWAELGDGAHTVVAYDEGQEFARSTFTVGTTGEPFVRGIESVALYARDFPAPGENACFVWNESTQHIELVTAGGQVIVPLPTPSQSHLGTCRANMSLQPGQVCESADRNGTAFTFYVDRFSFGCTSHPNQDDGAPPCQPKYGGWDRLYAKRNADGSWQIRRIE